MGSRISLSERLLLYLPCNWAAQSAADVVRASCCRVRSSCSTQLAFLDTPGFTHRKNKRAFVHDLRQAAEKAVRAVDAIVLVVDPLRRQLDFDTVTGLGQALRANWERSI